MTLAVTPSSAELIAAARLEIVLLPFAALTVMAALLPI